MIEPAIKDVPDGWVLDIDLGGFVRNVHPFGRLIVKGFVDPDAGAGRRWDARWQFTDELAWIIAGPFDNAEDAFAAAVRWLFDSWSAIEAQLEPEMPYRRDPVLNMLTGSLVGGLAVAIVLLALAWWL